MPLGQLHPPVSAGLERYGHSFELVTKTAPISKSGLILTEQKTLAKNRACLKTPVADILVLFTAIYVVNARL